MKLFGAVLCLAACLAPAFVRAGGQKIPGESPVEFCNADRSQDLMNVKSLDFSPNPPKGNRDVVMTLRGEVKKTIGRGSYVKFTVKYGLIQLLSTTMDFCEQIDVKCPLEVGDVVLQKNHTMGPTPPGTYNLLVDMYSDDDEQISCLKASVNIPQPSSSFNEL